jgi:hypothetical protein
MKILKTKKHHKSKMPHKSTNAPFLLQEGSSNIMATCSSRHTLGIKIREPNCSQRKNDERMKAMGHELIIFPF